MPAMRNAAPRGTGFIDFGRYLDANRPQAEAMAGEIADPIEQAGQGVLTDLETAQGKSSTTDTLLEGAAELGTRASDVAKRARATGSIGGIAAGIQDFTPKTSTYGLGMNLLDAGLTGAAGGERFQGLRDRYSGLFGRVTDAAKEAQQATQKPKVMTPVEEPAMLEERRPGRPTYKRDDLDRFDPARPRKSGSGKYNYDFL
jgi:hypothetical protein